MFTISNITFHKNLKQKVPLNKKFPEIEDFAHSKKWFLDNNKFTQKMRFQWFSHIQEVKIILLDLRSNKNDKIPSIIANINFPQLKYFISKVDNNISSVEVLQLINLQQLSTLTLGNNLLTSIRPLRKINCQLQILGLNGNRIQQLDSLSQMKCQKIEKLYIQYKKKQKNQGNNIDFLFKSNLINIKQMCKQKSYLGKVHQNNIEVRSLLLLKQKCIRL